MGTLLLNQLRAIDEHIAEHGGDPPCAVVRALVAEICEIFGAGSAECDEALEICERLECDCTPPGGS